MLLFIEYYLILFNLILFNLYNYTIYLILLLPFICYSVSLNSKLNNISSITESQKHLVCKEPLEIPYLSSCFKQGYI